MRGAVASAQTRLMAGKEQVTEELGNWEEWRYHGEEIRQHVLENLDYYLYQLSENVAKRVDMFFLLKLLKMLTDYIKDVVKKKNAKKIVKAKSMVTEEISLKCISLKRLAVK